MHIKYHKETCYFGSYCEVKGKEVPELLGKKKKQFKVDKKQTNIKLGKKYCRNNSEPN